jgi:shikimate kinase
MTTVVITGFMATGKSSVGRALAQRLSVPFVDTDVLVEKAEGRSVSEIFATEGEAYFRAAERAAISAALAVADAVVATGGGAVLDPENMRAMQAAAPIICLRASAEAIEARARTGGASRPLLAGPAPRERIAELLAQREPAYARADLLVDTTNRDVADLVEEVHSFLKTASH